jgi:hypothetical protein
MSNIHPRQTTRPPPRGREREADQAEHPAGPPRRYGKDQARPAYEYDLLHDLDSRGGHTRSIYGPKEDPPAHQEGYYEWLIRNDRVREQQRTRMAEDLRHDIARARGAAHPLCITERVMQHQFPEGFKCRRYALEAIINDIIYLHAHNYVYVPCYNFCCSRARISIKALGKTHVHA